eukprot:31565-Pelagococcus_subviridis.AAC.7
MLKPGDGTSVSKPGVSAAKNAIPAVTRKSGGRFSNGFLNSAPVKMSDVKHGSLNLPCTKTWNVTRRRLKNASDVFTARSFPGHPTPLNRHTMRPTNSSLSNAIDVSVLTGAHRRSRDGGFGDGFDGF